MFGKEIRKKVILGDSKNDDQVVVWRQDIGFFTTGWTQHLKVSKVPNVSILKNGDVALLLDIKKGSTLEIEAWPSPFKFCQVPKLPKKGKFRVLSIGESDPSIAIRLNPKEVDTAALGQIRDAINEGMHLVIPVDDRGKFALSLELASQKALVDLLKQLCPTVSNKCHKRLARVF